MRSAGGLQARGRGAEAARPLAGVRDGLAIAPRRRRRRRDRRPRHASDGGFRAGRCPDGGPALRSAAGWQRDELRAPEGELGCLDDFHRRGRVGFDRETLARPIPAVRRPRAPVRRSPPAYRKHDGLDVVHGEAGARHGPGGERAIEATRRSGSSDSRSASSASVRFLVDERARGETDRDASRPRPPTRCDDLVGRVDGSSGVARSADRIRPNLPPSRRRLFRERDRGLRGRWKTISDPGGKAPSRLRRRGSRDPSRRPGCHRHHGIRHRPASGVRCCDRQPNGVRRRFQRRLHLHETHSAVGQGIASIRERGRSAPLTESSSALSNTPGDPPIPPGIRRSLGRFSLLHISPSGRRSYAITAWKRMMASTGSPALSPIPAEAWSMLGRTDLEAYTSWDFPTQSDSGARAGDASFNGVTPARSAENLVRRYTGPGELVVDSMAGSGTIGDVARALGRRAVSFDLAPRRPHILRADARSWPLSAQTAALAVIDSPYSDNVVYSPDSRCLGRISCRDARFYEEMEKVASEAHRVLRPGGFLGWIIADEYRRGVYTPVGFRLLRLLETRFQPIDTIVLVRPHDRSSSPMWEHRARRFNFFLRGFKFLFILRKQAGEPGG